ncbi:MAG: ParB/RepB/Spo0J family partition protein, partial [Candidatus Sumerlaeota bacterium]
MTDINAISQIPLNKLTAWEGNVRKTQTKGGIDELAANIKAIGLQQNLIVTKDGKKFAVVAGARRLAALQKLAKAKEIDDDHPVPCQIAGEGANLSEISLSENTVRENMHPADECEAFTKLAEGGMPIPDIAGRFGRTERYVQQRLRIARGISPKIMKAYRAGEITLQHVEAFAVSDDFKAQDDVFKDFDPQYDDADEIRDKLTRDDISAIDRRVKYVTLAAYEAEGGKLKRDLFGDEKDVYILDAAVLDKLVNEKLA